MRDSHVAQDISLEHKYTINRIKSFVYFIFSLYDERVDVSIIYPYLTDNELIMKFPDKEIYSYADFADWYEGNDQGDRIVSNTHEVEVLQAETAATGEYRVELDVLWKALLEKSGSTALRTRQRWVLVEGDGQWPKIKHHEAEQAA